MGDDPRGLVSDPPDEVLVAAVLNGDTDAFGGLVRRYQEPYLLYAGRMVASRAVAEDIVQDCFVTAYEKLKTCERPERFASWCFHIVRNRCHDYLRSPRSQMSGPEVLESLPVVEEDPAESAERADLRSALLRAIDSLPPLLREAFVLYHEQSQTYPQMAERLGASESALKMRVKRAREQLQEQLAGFGDEAGR